MMSRALMFTLLLMSFSAVKLQAQKTRKDSITRIAQADSKNFRLNKTDLKKFRKDRRNYNSDFFKPPKVRDSTLLKDSLYLKAFRDAAYKKTRKRRTAGHYVIIGAANYATGLIGTIILFTNGLLPGQ